MNERLAIRRVAVLGAGVMGAQIAAHMVNAEVPVLLFELPGEGEDPNSGARKAIDRLRTLAPQPLALAADAALIRPANYDDDLDRLAECDLIVEAVAERLDVKQALYERIAAHVGPHAVLASNTSGLGINALADVLPPTLRKRFCGVHFFNPPRYMHLVEVIPGKETEASLLRGLETFLVTGLGKGVVYARDTPNFIGNRIGVFALLAAMHHADRLGLGPDEVDALTGPAIGRPKSATFRTADVVGLDTLAHVVEGSAPRLSNDPWQSYLRLSDWMRSLIDQGSLGQKSGAGVYRKEGREIHVLDPSTGRYRPANTGIDDALQRVLSLEDPEERFAALRQADHPQADFLWAIHRDTFHYAAYLLEDIADTARDVDFALRWGFGWKQGPFEIWQAAGWRRIATWIQDDIATGQAMSNAPLPSWVDEIDAVHTARGSWSPNAAEYRSRSALPVYRRQRFPDAVLGEQVGDTGSTVFQTEGVRLWQVEEDIAILSFRSRNHTIGHDVLEGVMQAVDEAERRFDGLVLWQPSEPFSVGANLKQVLEALDRDDYDSLSAMVQLFQQATGRLRHASIPVIAAVRGMALGGGCEFQMHCDRTVAALESYIGLVEAGVGLIPAGGGCKELARRASEEAPGGDIFPYIGKSFELVAKGTVARSAREAQTLGLLRRSDRVVMHVHELLHAATAEARALAAAGYRPPLHRPVRVLGRNGIATLRTSVVNLREGGYISEHDARVASAAADVLCGGDVDAGTLVSEDWLLHREWEQFVALLRTPETRERIAHTMKTGKPLRN